MRVRRHPDHPRNRCFFASERNACARLVNGKAATCLLTTRSTARFLTPQLSYHYYPIRIHQAIPQRSKGKHMAAWQICSVGPAIMSRLRVRTTPGRFTVCLSSDDLMQINHTCTHLCDHLALWRNSLQRWCCMLGALKPVK